VISLLDSAFWHVAVAVSGTVLVIFLADGYRPVSRCDLTDGRSWNLLAKRSVRQIRSLGEIEIIDGAAFEDISCECFAAITRNIDSN
jgi:hypothetical protein